MRKNLLVTGVPGCGKTTLAERVAAALGPRAGGFLSREIREAGRRVGFSLRTLDVPPAEVRDRLRERMQRRDKLVVGQVPFSPRGRKALELAMGESDRLGLRHIGTEHLLLGLAGLADGLVAEVLSGVSVEALRGHVESGPAASAGPRERPGPSRTELDVAVRLITLEVLVADLVERVERLESRE